jgi:hypothetical protein
MAGIANTDNNFAGWAAFCQKVFGRSNYVGDVAADSQTAITAGTPRRLADTTPWYRLHGEGRSQGRQHRHVH